MFDSKKIFQKGLYQHERVHEDNSTFAKRITILMRLYQILKPAKPVLTWWELGVVIRCVECVSFGLRRVILQSLVEVCPRPSPKVNHDLAVRCQKPCSESFYNEVVTLLKFVVFKQHVVTGKNLKRLWVLLYRISKDHEFHAKEALLILMKIQ